MNPINLIAVASFSPKSLQAPDAWVGHLPFASWIIREKSPGIFVELGTHSGNSYFSFCQAVLESGLKTKCFAVDTWQGDEHAGQYDDLIFNTVNSHHQENYAGFSRLLRMTFDAAVDYFADQSVDVLHIDGLHTYEAVKHDFETWLPKLAPGAIVMFHDTNVRERNFGVWKLWNELQAEYPNNIEFVHSNGLGVLQLNVESPGQPLDWLTGSFEEKQKLKDYFAALGRYQYDRFYFERLKERATALEKSSAEQNQLIERYAGENAILAEKLGVSDVNYEKSLEVRHRNQLEIQNFSLLLEDSKAKLSRFNELLIERDHVIAGLYNSTSWKITRPVRSLSRFARTIINESPLGKKGPLFRYSLALRTIFAKVAVAGDNLPADFDQETYLKLNSDVAAAGVDPVSHYLRHGRREGRPFTTPRILLEHNHRDEVKTILVVSHEASRTGAPVLSLNLVRALVGDANVVVLLLGGGALCEAFRETGATVIEANQVRGNAMLADSVINQLCKQFQFKFALVNSIESRAVLPMLAANGVPTISLIHEFASYTRPRDAFKNALFWSSEVVFSANVTMENAYAEFPELNTGAAHILPQGRCLVPSNELAAPQRMAEEARLNHAMRPEESGEGIVVVLGAGAVQLRKGLDLFIECAAQVVRAPGGNKFRFVWIGKGFDPEHDINYSVYLADQIRRADLNDHVFIIDETPLIDKAYELADIFLLSSRLDPLPNVAIDAMSCGVPVVCFAKTTGIADFLIASDLAASCVSEYLDVTDMAAKVLALGTSTGLRHTVALHAQESARAYFDMPTYVSRLLTLTDKVRDRAATEQADAKLIAESGLFRMDFSSAATNGKQEKEAEVRFYVRAWASGIGRRKPFPGFHPGMYLEMHGVAKTESDPFADYLRSGRPQGPWNYPVITLEKSKQIPAAAAGKVALHLHIHYVDLLPEIIRRLAKNATLPDLFVSITNESIRDQVGAELKKYAGRVRDIQRVPNRGRDIGPFVTAFGKVLVNNYDIVGHIHTKRSASVADASMGQKWSNFLLENLLGGEAGAAMDQIVDAMTADTSIGMVFPDDPHVIGLTGNREFAEQLGARLGMGRLPEYFIFPVGTMFWARSTALMPMMDLNLGWDDYPDEPVPYDGTMLHAMERMFSLSLACGPLRAATTNIAGLTR